MCYLLNCFDISYNKYRECKQCNIERSIKRYFESKDKISNQQKIYYGKKDNFYNKYGECKQCNIKRSLKRFYGNKNKISNQQKIFYEKIRKNYYTNRKIDVYTSKNYFETMLN